LQQQLQPAAGGPVVRPHAPQTAGSRTYSYKTDGNVENDGTPYGSDVCGS
jgi:hypothetical protein